MVPPDAILESAPAKLRRPPTKRRLILHTLRNQIAKGELAPGEQLPTRTQLAERFEASSVTIQDALDRLIQDGVVVAMGRQGTFVAQRPPHLHQYGIVFPSLPGSQDWARYWTALTNEAHAMEAGGSRRFKLYHGVNNLPGNPGKQELASDVRNQRLAGVVLTFPPVFIDGREMFAECGVPLIAMTLADTFPGTPCIGLDYGSMMERALDDLAARGAKRIACLMLPQMTEAFTDALLRGIQSRGMSTRPEWFQAIPYTPAHWISNLTRLMMQGGRNERPNGLFITDDNLVEPASAGLVGAGIAGPQDLKVAAHCNFPWPTPSHLPMRRVGFDIRRTLDVACALVDSRRAGREVAEFTGISAVFEDEIPGALTSRDRKGVVFS